MIARQLIQLLASEIRPRAGWRFEVACSILARRVGECDEKPGSRARASDVAARIAFWWRF
jgi:hypothetical protein